LVPGRKIKHKMIKILALYKLAINADLLIQRKRDKLPANINRVLFYGWLFDEGFALPGR
jgi:hypothetical protein